MSAAQNAYLDSAGAFPLLVPGDQIFAEAFTNAANRGWKTVVSRTASTVVVAEAGLMNEAVPAEAEDARMIRVATIPEDVEQAAVETVKGWYLSRERDRSIQSTSVGDLSVTYDDASGDGEKAALPFTAITLLAPWVRLA